MTKRVIARPHRVAQICVRGHQLIGYSVLKVDGGEQAAFFLHQYCGEAVIARRHAQNLCDQLNGIDAEFDSFVAVKTVPVSAPMVGAKEGMK